MRDEDQSVAIRRIIGDKSAAAFAGCAPATIYRARRAGRLAAVRVNARRYDYELTELQRWMQSRGVPACPHVRALSPEFEREIQRRVTAATRGAFRSELARLHAALGEFLTSIER